MSPLNCPLVAMAFAVNVQVRHVDLGAVGLLHTGLGRQAEFLRFDDCQRHVAPVVEQVVGATLFASAHLAARHDDAAVGGAVLFTDDRLGGAPPRCHQLGRDELAAAIGFSHVDCPFSSAFRATGRPGP